MDLTGTMGRAVEGEARHLRISGMFASTHADITAGTRSLFVHHPPADATCCAMLSLPGGTSSCPPLSEVQPARMCDIDVRSAETCRQ